MSCHSTDSQPTARRAQRHTGKQSWSHDEYTSTLTPREHRGRSSSAVRFQCAAHYYSEHFPGIPFHFGCVHAAASLLHGSPQQVADICTLDAALIGVVTPLVPAFFLATVQQPQLTTRCCGRRLSWHSRRSERLSKPTTHTRIRTAACAEPGLEPLTRRTPTC